MARDPWPVASRLDPLSQLAYHVEVCRAMPGIWIIKSDEFYGSQLAERGGELARAAAEQGCDAVLSRRPLGGWALSMCAGVAA